MSTLLVAAAVVVVVVVVVAAAAVVVVGRFRITKSVVGLYCPPLPYEVSLGPNLASCLSSGGDLYVASLNRAAYQLEGPTRLRDRFTYHYDQAFLVLPITETYTTPAARWMLFGKVYRREPNLRYTA